MTFDSVPEHLNEYGAQEWTRIIGIYRQRGLLDALHYTTLEAYCAAYGDWRAARRMIKAMGQYTKDKRGRIIPNPALDIERQAGVRFRALVAELKMVEKAEKAAERGEGGGDPVGASSFEAFLGVQQDTRH